MDNLDSKYTPISMWGYFGYNILFGLPIIGFIILIIFALGHHNVNVRNYARSFFCGFILTMILVLILLSSGILANILNNIGG